MNKFTNLYPCSHYEAEHVEYMAEEAAANGYKEILPELTGYVLVNKRLVPFTFVERLKNAIKGKQFEYRCVLSEVSIFGDEFLQSLDKEEREVLLPCALMLIERGDFEVNLFESDDEEEAA